jgi:hypothetical protein
MTLEERRMASKGMYIGEAAAAPIAIIVGVALLFWRRVGGPDFTFPVAWAAITLGWALMAYVYVRRAMFVRSDNSDPKA